MFITCRTMSDRGEKLWKKRLAIMDLLQSTTLLVGHLRMFEEYIARKPLLQGGRPLRMISDLLTVWRRLGNCREDAPLKSLLNSRGNRRALYSWYTYTTVKKEINAFVQLPEVVDSITRLRQHYRSADYARLSETIITAARRLFRMHGEQSEPTTPLQVTIEIESLATRVFSRHVHYVLDDLPTASAAAAAEGEQTRWERLNTAELLVSLADLLIVQ